MAELVFKIDTKGPDPQYQDGDCLCAFMGNIKDILEVLKDK